jgi:hypothetical protein
MRSSGSSRGARRSLERALARLSAGPRRYALQVDRACHSSPPPTSRRTAPSPRTSGASGGASQDSLAVPDPGRPDPDDVEVWRRPRRPWPAAPVSGPGSRGRSGRSSPLQPNIGSSRMSTRSCPKSSSANVYPAVACGSKTTTAVSRGRRAAQSSRFLSISRQLCHSRSRSSRVAALLCTSRLTPRLVRLPLKGEPAGSATRPARPHPNRSWPSRRGSARPRSSRG